MLSFARGARTVLAFSTAIVVLESPATAQSKRPMSPVDLIEVPRVLEPQVSPDGKQVLYVLERADWKENRRVGHIWRVNADGSSAVQLTHGQRGETNPRWSPDGKRIAFLTRRGDNEDPQIYVLENDGGEARQLTKHPAAVSRIEWRPDSAAIYFLAPDAKTQEEKERDKLKDDVYAFDENFKQRHVWTASVQDGTTHKVTQGDYSVLSYSLSEDGKKVALHRAISPILEHAATSEVWVMNVDGTAPLQLTRNSVSENGARLSPDNTQVLFTTGSNAKFESYYNSTLFVVPAAGGDARPLAADAPDVEGGASWSKSGRSIYFVGNYGVHSQIVEIDVASKAVKPLTKGQHSLQAWDFAGAADRHVFVLDDPSRAEAWLLPAGGGAPTQVTRAFDATVAAFALPKQERVEWKGSDGATVEGLLYYPTDYRAGTSYPLVVQTHGGPQASDKFAFGGWNSYVQVLTGKGYAVLKPNYRGSTGYGNAFLRDMVGHYFNQAHLDVMAGVDHVIKLGVADPDKLVKMGWSGGGHMTNKIITFTDRFKAASSGAGAANWVSMYAQSDTRTQRTPWFGGTPWEANAPIDKYWNDSPLKYVSSAKTPTIFLVGEQDVRVPPPQSVEMYRALKHNGVPTRLYMAPREPHGWGELRHQLFKMNAELEWFEKYVTGRRYEWVVAPGDAPRGPARTTTTAQ